MMLLVVFQMFHSQNILCVREKKDKIPDKLLGVYNNRLKPGTSGTSSASPTASGILLGVFDLLDNLDGDVPRVREGFSSFV